MNKRDTVLVVFRVVAIFILLTLLASLPTIILTIVQYAILPTSTFTDFFRMIFLFVIQFAIVYLLWNRSGWIADKILAPFGMNELFNGEILPEEEEVSEENTIHELSLVEPEQTVTHLSRDEIESLALTVIAVWILSSSIPELLRMLVGFLSTDKLGIGSYYEFIGLVSPFIKTLIAGWLLFRSNNLVAWLAKWRQSRMAD